MNRKLIRVLGLDPLSPVKFIELRDGDIFRSLSVSGDPTDQRVVNARFGGACIYIKLANDQTNAGNAVGLDGPFKGEIVHFSDEAEIEIDPSCERGKLLYRIIKPDFFAPHVVTRYIDRPRGRRRGEHWQHRRRREAAERLSQTATG